MAFTPNRRLGFSQPPTAALFLTPRPEKRPLDLRWFDGGSNSSRNDRDKEVNVQVILRCRPLSDEEQRLNVQKVISCNEQKKEVTVMHSLVSKQVDKTFTFNKVFGPKAQQRSIYEHAISPIVSDVLEGFNCTVFAYGQTGTGKTYTMEGGAKSKGGDLPADAGVIARAVRHIFDTLEGHKSDYSMKVTFMELYNEEITDLLAPDEHTKFLDDKQRRPISLMEDGKGGAVIRGLEEVVVYSAHEIYSLLERGSAKRRTADTLLNKQSSRSHSVFSVTIHVKEKALANEELVKCGRLNLVDLAGSENISRSGAREGRAREAGELNKSLLTLGRVITALADHSTHIPYRDSKLTRLLRESLGGKAKTCIIATVSPSVHCLEETLSTLEYAYRAKSIKNKPEANQKYSKAVLLKDLYSEIERMKQDVRAARGKDGIYIPPERFAQDEADRKAMNEKLELLEFELKETKKQADKFKELYHAEQERNLDLESDLRECKMTLEESNRTVVYLKEIQLRNEQMLKEKEHLISSLINSERDVLECAKDLHSNLENASDDISRLLNKTEWQSNIATKNKDLIKSFGSQLDQSLQSLNRTVISSVIMNHESLKSMEKYLDSFIATKCEASKCLEMRIERMKAIYSSGILQMKQLVFALENKAFSDVEKMTSTLISQILAVENFLVTAASEAEKILIDVQDSLSKHKSLLESLAQQQDAGLQRTLVSTQIISKKAIDLFRDIRSLTCRFTTLLEENQSETSHCLTQFEETFKDISAKEEKEALDKIAYVLTNLTMSKQNMVSKVLSDMKDSFIEQKRKQGIQASDLQIASDNSEEELISCLQAEANYIKEDRASAANVMSGMGNNLSHCSMQVGQSLHHWKSIHSSIGQLNKDFTAEVESSIEKKKRKDKELFEELVLVSSENDLKFESGVRDLQDVANESLLLDHEAEKEIQSMSTFCFDSLGKLQENHIQSIRDVTSLADKYLMKDYLVDHPTGATPRKIVINVPSPSSIENLSTNLEELAMQYRSGNGFKVEFEVKQQLQIPVQNTRSPFTPINKI